MATNLDLLIDPWVSTSQGLASLSQLMTNPRKYREITESPLTRHAVLRLLLAINGASNRNQPRPGEMLLRGTDGRPGFLQATGLPSEGRSPWAILSLQDANNAALSPIGDPRSCTDADLARALVTAFFCDRGGLKAQIKGLPISGSKPTHMGQLIAWRWGNNLEDFLELNAIPISSWVPWWKRPVSYDETWTENSRSVLKYLMWPWRRLQVNHDTVTIAAGASFPDKTITDPWAVGRAGLKHVYGKVTAEMLVKDKDKPDGSGWAWAVQGLVLNQATPVAWVNMS